MTDRVNYLTVVLNRDYRADDVQMLINAIQMLNGVYSVNYNVVNPDDYVAKERALSEIRNKIFEILK